MELRERKQDESLREKLRYKMHTREFTPAKDYSDTMAMCAFFAMSISLLLECLIWLIPRLFPETKLIFSLLTFFIFCETMLNWHRSYYDVDNYVRVDTKQKYCDASQEETPQGWITCLKCQVDAPPRSHHCNPCGKCMLKRDHHCFFTGSCVGFHNQKFFIIFCLWTFITSLYTMILQLSYLHMDLPLNSSDVITYIAPVTLHKWIMGYISFGQVLIIAHVYACVFMSLISLFFFSWQLLITSQGLTSHEAWKRILIFQGSSVTDNLKSVFGSLTNIPVLVFVPYRFEQEGDGITWKVRSKRVKGQ